MCLVIQKILKILFSLNHYECADVLLWLKVRAKAKKFLRRNLLPYTDNMMLFSIPSFLSTNFRCKHFLNIIQTFQTIFNSFLAFLLNIQNALKGSFLLWNFFSLKQPKDDLQRPLCFVNRCVSSMFECLNLFSRCFSTYWNMFNKR